MQNKLLDNLMQMAGGAMNVVTTVQEAIREEVKTALNAMVDEEQFVRREEFEALKAEVAKLKAKEGE